MPETRNLVLSPAQKLRSRLMNPQYLMVYATIGIFLLIYLLGALLYGKRGFTSVRTFMLFFSDNAYIGISAVGMTLVLITGGIDLSVAAVASLTGMIIAYGTTVLGMHPLVCIGIALVAGVGLGALMGACIQYLNVPPFITTLTGMFFARGVCSLISRESISIKHSMIDALAGFKVYLTWPNDKGEWVKIKPVASIDLNTIAFIVIILIGAYILQRTRFGRNVNEQGGNEQSAQLMGQPVARTKVLVYSCIGLCSVLAGIAYVLIVKSGWNLALQGAELDVISACVIGGVMLSGGVGYMFGTLFGVLLKATIPAIITFNGSMNSWWAKIFTSVLLLFIIIQRAVIASSQRTRKRG